MNGFFQPLWLIRRRETGSGTGRRPGKRRFGYGYPGSVLAKKRFGGTEEALTDGSIHVDIWTDKGHNKDVLVYSEGEELQLYFRVNQPCFLQLSYFLATGEKALLEENFYIGIDKVSRVVPLPYKFEVIPPPLNFPE